MKALMGLAYVGLWILGIVLIGLKISGASNLTWWQTLYPWLATVALFLTTVGCMLVGDARRVLRRRKYTRRSRWGA